MKRALVVVSLLVAAAFGAAMALLTQRIRDFADIDEASPADVIVVLGAAEYRGNPSPVLRARLDHALDLHRRKLAPRVLTTGGAGGDPQFTEGEVGRDYLIRNGVPSEAIIVEEEGSSTAESIAAAAEIMRRMSLRTCILVTDGYHAFRSKRTMEAHGVTVFSSPRRGGSRDPGRYWGLCARQAFAYLLWRAGVVI